jgi:hypothetical protein
MYLYNETIGIDKEIESQWLQWIKINYINAAMNSGMFKSFKMYKVLHDQDDGTISYSLQYLAEDINDVMNYLENYAPALIEAHRSQFKDKHVVFRTLLEEV